MAGGNCCCHRWRLGVAGAVVAVVGAANMWAWSIPDERTRKRFFLFEFMLAADAMLYCLLAYYLQPVLVARVTWRQPALAAALSRALWLIGGCALAMYPLMRGFGHYLPTSPEPPTLQLAIFACFGVMLVLTTVTMLADAAERVAAGCVLAAAACARWLGWAPQRSGEGGRQGSTGRGGGDSDMPGSAGGSSTTVQPGATTRRRAAAAAATPTAAPAPPSPSAVQPSGGSSCGTDSGVWDVIAWRRQRGVAWGTAVLGITAAIVGPATWQAATAPAVVHVTVPLLRLPPALDGFRIVQLSDIHVGPTVGAAAVARVVELANAQRGDAVVLTGDVIDGDEEQYAAAAAPLARLSAPEVYFCSGNHDSYDGSYPAKVALLHSLGVTVLHNAATQVPATAAANGGPTFDLIGVGDWTAAVLSGPQYAANLTTAAAGLDGSRESILLAHQPKHMAEARQWGIGLQLSGHTHGGQLAPLHIPVYLGNPFFAGYYLDTTAAASGDARLAGIIAATQAAGAALPHGDARLRAGQPPPAAAAGDGGGGDDGVWAKAAALAAALARHEWPTQLYVSRGSLYWGPPMRLFAPHEVTVITLRSVPALAASLQ